jgi:hypothetical protein
MNDHEEVRFGINQGLGAVQRSEVIMKACGSAEDLQGKFSAGRAHNIPDLRTSVLIPDHHENPVFTE